MPSDSLRLSAYAAQQLGLERGEIDKLRTAARRYIKSKFDASWFTSAGFEQEKVGRVRAAINLYLNDPTIGRDDQTVGAHLFSLDKGRPLSWPVDKDQIVEELMPVWVHQIDLERKHIMHASQAKTHPNANRLSKTGLNRITKSTSRLSGQRNRLNIRAQQARRDGPTQSVASDIEHRVDTRYYLIDGRKYVPEKMANMIAAHQKLIKGFEHTLEVERSEQELAAIRAFRDNYETILQGNAEDATGTEIWKLGTIKME